MSHAVDDTPDSAPHDSEVLELDADTKKDLNLFGSSSEPESLFEFCDRCRTDGGKMALRKRMANPWANAERIRDTQRSISFMLQHRELFGGLPSAYVTKNVER